MTFQDIPWPMFFTGLGLFFFGVSFMGDSLKSYAGDKLRDVVNKYTSSPLKGVLVGAIMTAIVQSSSATTAITIGFVRAGIMSLSQATGIIIGANIGTTMTAFLIGLKIDSLAVIFIFISAILMMFIKNKKILDIARIAFGFGTLFYGIKLLSTSLVVLKDIPAIQEFVSICTENPFIGLIGGVVVTCIMQSSSAAIGVIQAIYETKAAPFIAVLPFLFGSNIGTTITAWLASLGGNTSGKRAALIHLIFNVIGTILAMLLLYPLNSLMNLLVERFNISAMMQIAVVHIIFNVVTAILVFPFISQLCLLVKNLIKGEEPKQRIFDVEKVDPASLPVAAVGFEITHNSLNQLNQLVMENVKNVEKYIAEEKDNHDLFEEIQANEELIDKFDSKIINFLTKIDASSLSQTSTKVKTLHFETARNLERIGDLALNLAEFAQLVIQGKEKFSNEAKNEILILLNKLDEINLASMQYFNDKDINNYEKIIKIEAQVDKLTSDFIDNHLNRINNDSIVNSPKAISVYTDIVTTIERMADHCCNIGKGTFIRMRKE